MLYFYFFWSISGKMTMLIRATARFYSLVMHVLHTGCQNTHMIVELELEEMKLSGQNQSYIVALILNSAELNYVVYYCPLDLMTMNKHETIDWETIYTGSKVILIHCYFH